jgi:DNA invertase Pin-like site-specific DNA recombinase
MKTTNRTKVAGLQTVAVGYLRVSTDEQHLGPEAQRAALEAWAKAHGVRLVTVHEDLGVSGGAALDKRPGLMAALDALAEHGAGLLLVAKRDRLARDVVLAAMVGRLVERAGGRIVAADGAGNDEGPAGELMRTMLDAFAQYERALIRARTRSALQVKRNRLEYTGGAAPYGWRLGPDGTHLEALEAEQAIIQAARALQASGLSLRRIGAELERQGMLGRAGGQWNPASVRSLLRAPLAESNAKAA